MSFWTHDPPRPGLRILVVEPEPTTAELLGHVLSTENHAVSLAADAYAAMAWTRRHRPHIVLVGTARDQLLAWIGNLEPSQRPVVVELVAAEEPADPRPQFHLVKPVTPEALCALIREVRQSLPPSRQTALPGIPRG